MNSNLHSESKGLISVKSMASFCSKETGSTLTELGPKFVAWQEQGSGLLWCLTSLAVVLVNHTTHCSALYEEESQKHLNAELKAINCDLFY